MSDLSWIIAIIAITGIIPIIIGRQLVGAPLFVKRLVLLPAILAVIGFIELAVSNTHVRPLDVACLVVDAVIVAGIGLAQGAVMRLESRNGSLWGQLPVKGLWLWLLLISSRVLMTVIANGLGAHIAASHSAILLLLGISRLGQAAAVLARARSMRIAFTTEQDGTSFLSGRTGQAVVTHHRRVEPEELRKPLACPCSVPVPRAGALRMSHRRVLHLSSPTSRVSSYLGDRRHAR